MGKKTGQKLERAGEFDKAEKLRAKQAQQREWLGKFWHFDADGKALCNSGYGNLTSEPGLVDCNKCKRKMEAK